MLARAIAIAVLIGATCSAIFVMPPFVQTESALDLSLPRNWDSWQIETEAPSENETKILAEDTRFSKARCVRQRTEEMSYIFGTSPVDQVDLSIVLSGHDLANSIHRPERCMAAQGHRIQESQKSSLALPNGRQLPLTRLTTKRDVSFKGPDGEPVQITVNCITYYFFVGEEDLTADHTERTVIDIRDRVLDGKAQRWAYVLVSIIYQDQAEHEYGAPFPTLDLADEKARDLIARLAGSNINWSRIKP